MVEVFYLGKEIMDFMNGIALSIIAGFIFYTFQVIIPERKRKEVAKKHLLNSYEAFKLKTLGDFLTIIGKYDKNTRDLMNFNKFKNFFKEKSEVTNQSNWYLLINSYEDSQNAFRELIYDIERIQSETSFILNNFLIYDEELFLFIKRFEDIVSNFKGLGDDKDKYEIYYKEFWRFIWSLYSGWNLVEGQRESDIFTDMVKKI